MLKHQDDMKSSVDSINYFLVYYGVPTQKSQNNRKTTSSRKPAEFSDIRTANIEYGIKTHVKQKDQEGRTPNNSK